MRFKESQLEKLIHLPTWGNEEEPCKSKPVEHEQQNYQLWEALTWDTEKVSCVIIGLAKVKHTWQALPVLLSELTAKNNFTFNVTKEENNCISSCVRLQSQTKASAADVI